MPHITALLCFSFVIIFTQNVFSKDSPVAGVQTLSVSLSEVSELTKGWSVKKSILYQSVYNEADEVIGEVKDLIIAPNSKVSYAIVGTGSFLGLNQHDVAIPIKKFQMKEDGKVSLNGATKEALKKMPPFRYL